MASNNRREKFTALVAKRVPNVRKSIKVLRNLTNKNAYEFTDSDWKKILGCIRDDLDALEKLAATKRAGGKDDLGFTL